MEKIEFEKRLFEAIKKDDLKSFTFLMPTNSDLNLCYGRFPILSLLYMYSSFKILAKFEKKLMQIHDFKITQESLEMYKKFRAVAKRSLRLFEGDKIIYPIEMLAVLNEKTILENNYIFLYKNVEIIDNIKKIYKLNHKNDIKLDGKTITINSKKFETKHCIFAGCICLVFAFIICFSSFFMCFISNKNGVGSLTNPIKIASAQEFSTALRKGKRNYLLTQDIVVDASSLNGKEFSATFFGNGKTVTIEGESSSAMIKNLTGTVQDLTIRLSNNKMKITQNSAIISENSSGIISNCKILGNFELEFSADDESFVGLFTAVNEGVVQNCETNVSGTLINNKESNAYFSVFVGQNKENGKIENCKASNGIMIADTVDISGIAGQNYGEIINCQNYVSLSQTSNKEWHPNVAGITIQNYGKIDACKNFAELESKSSVLVAKDGDSVYYVFVAGIVCENYNEISDSRNFGTIIASGDISNIVAGGIASQNGTDGELVGKVNTSLCRSDINVKSESGQVCVGGVVGMNASTISASGFEGDIVADTNISAKKNDIYQYKFDSVVAVLAGGVVGINLDSEIKNSYAVATFSGADSLDDSTKVYSGFAGVIGIHKYKVKVTSIFGEGYTDDYKGYAFDSLSGNYYVAPNDEPYEIYGCYETLESRNGGLYYYSGQLVLVEEMLLSEFRATEKIVKLTSVNDIPTEVKISD